MSEFEFEKITYGEDEEPQYHLIIGPFAMFVYQEDDKETFGFDLDGLYDSIEEEGMDPILPESFKIPNSGYESLREAKIAALKQCHIYCGVAMQDLIDALEEHSDS